MAPSLAAAFGAAAGAVRFVGAVVVTGTPVVTTDVVPAAATSPATLEVDARRRRWPPRWRASGRRRTGCPRPECLLRSRRRDAGAGSSMRCWSHVILRRAAALRCVPAAKSLAPVRPRPPETYRASAGQLAPVDQAVRRGGEQRRTSSEGECFRSAHVRCCTRGRRPLRPLVPAGGSDPDRGILTRSTLPVRTHIGPPRPQVLTLRWRPCPQGIRTRYRDNTDKSCEVSHRHLRVSCGQPLRQTVTGREGVLTDRSRAAAVRVRLTATPGPYPTSVADAGHCAARRTRSATSACSTTVSQRRAPVVAAGRGAHVRVGRRATAGARRARVGTCRRRTTCSWCTT